MPNNIASKIYRWASLMWLVRSLDHEDIQLILFF